MLTLFLVLFSLVLFSIIFLAIKNKSLRSCNNYIVNVYLYIMLSLLFTRLVIYFIDAYVPKDFIYGNKLAFIFTSFLLTIIFLGIMYYMKNTFLIYLSFFSYLFFLGSMIYISFKHYENTIDLEEIYFQVFLIFMIMTILAIFFKNFLNKYDNYILIGLLVGLVAVIIASIYNILINNKNIEEYKSVSKIISIITIVIFAIFISYDTNVINRDATTCKIANYPTASVDLVTDLINLFLSLSNIESM